MLKNRQAENKKCICRFIYQSSRSSRFEARESKANIWLEKWTWKLKGWRVKKKKKLDNSAMKILKTKAKE